MEQLLHQVPLHSPKYIGDKNVLLSLLCTLTKGSSTSMTPRKFLVFFPCIGNCICYQKILYSFKHFSSLVMILKRKIDNQPEGQVVWLFRVNCQFFSESALFFTSVLVRFTHRTYNKKSSKRYTTAVPNLG